VQFTAKFTTRKADQDTNNMYTLLIGIPWYVFLVVHLVGILVRFPGCTLSWYFGTLCWYHNPTSQQKQVGYLTTDWLPWLQTNWRDSGYERGLLWYWRLIA